MPSRPGVSRKRIPLLAALAALLLWSGPAFAKPEQPRHVELAVMIEKFMPSANSEGTGIPWDTESGNL